MTHKVFDDEALLMAALKTDSHEAFFVIFRRYYYFLVLFAGRFIQDRDTCEDIVQDVFTQFWHTRKSLEIKSSLRSYLTTLVQNLALNKLKHNKVEESYLQVYEELMSDTPEDVLRFNELNEAIEQSLAKLAPEVRLTLMLSREEKLKYSEIAERLKISVKTVEARISKALRFIQADLERFKIIILLIIATEILL
ncbi:MAG: RNA polymerase sigma-70 factor [Bacteroidales bacterium]|nr:RNA polymerase sigma-70 factor [Bacteroidales bacterium]